MPINEINISIEELRKVDIKYVINQSTNKLCDSYAWLFTEDNTNNATKVLASLCSMMLDTNNSNIPFSAMFTVDNQTSARPGLFTNETLGALLEFHSEIEDAELRARVSDLLWVEKRGAIAPAYCAITAYIESANTLFLSEDWYYAFKRLERALQLSIKFRKQRPDLYTSATELLKKHLTQQIEANGNPALRIRLLRAAFNYRIEDSQWIYDQALGLGEALAKAKNYHFATDSLDIARLCSYDLKDSEKRYKIFEEIANCHIAESELHNAMLASGCIMQAIDALQNVPNSRQRRLELYELMRDLQRESLHQMTEISFSSGDMSEIAEQCIELVKGVNYFDALMRLALLVAKPTDISKVKEQANIILENSIFHLVGSQTHIDHEGMPVANVTGSGRDPESQNEALWSSMMQYLRDDHRLQVSAQIRPALNEVMDNHHIHEEAIQALLRNHPFVPVGHIEFFSKGLLAGLQGDFLTANHLLIPQIENSLRYLLSQQGEEPTTHHGNGDQQRNPLTMLLEHPGIVHRLGKNIATNLKAILTDKIYGDLRNQTSHGYVSSTHFYSDGSIYLWWLLLHIIMNSYYTSWKAVYGKNLFKSNQTSEKTPPSA